MPIDRYYTPQALADATGLNVSQCRTLIAQSPDKLCISRNPDSRKKRWAISERGFRELVDRHRRSALVDQRAREEKQQPQKPQRTPKKQNLAELGFTPDGKIPNSRQLKAAGKWKGA